MQHLPEKTRSSTTKWYQIQVLDAHNVPTSLGHHIERNELYVGPSTRLAGVDQGASAMLEDKLLAAEFAAAILPIIKKRYGRQTSLKVVKWTGANYFSEKEKSRLEEHSRIIKARLATGNFAPNKPA